MLLSDPLFQEGSSLMNRRYQFLGLCMFLVIIAIGAPLMRADTENALRDQPIELGAIDWRRGFEEAQSVARSADKPMLVLFQEVPGCGTCKSYGKHVLSHPLIVEAAETLFVPTAVYNNIAGADAKTLKSFDEPAWNNPVVRIITADRAPLTTRLADDYSVGGLAESMAAALAKAKREVPKYLELLAAEQRSRTELQKATFAMHCFWEGERALGRIDGVVATMPGFVDKLEVVEVEFDPRAIAYDKLVARVRKLHFADRVFTRSSEQHEQAQRLVGDAAVRSDEPIRPDKQPKYYLAQTPLKHVPMTSLQACRVNAAAGSKEDPLVYLSPRQNALLEVIKKHPDAAWPDALLADDFGSGWSRAGKIARGLLVTAN